MKLEDAVSAADGLDPKTKAAIAKMIDTKVESDMEKVLNKMDAMANSLKAELSNMETRFESQFIKMETRFDSKFNIVDNRLTHMDSRFNLVYGGISIAIALLGLILAIALKQ